MEINNFSRSPFPTIPTAFTNSMTYLEQLEWLYTQFLELQKSIENIDTESNKYTDEQITILRNDLQNQLNILNETLLSEVSRLDDSIRNEVIILNQKINTDIKLLDETLRKYSDNNDKVLNDRITYEVGLLNIAIQDSIEFLIDYINNSIIDIELLNPLTGKQETLQDVINSIANLLKTGSITASEYDLLMILAGEYDALNITAYDYDFNAKNILT